MQVLDVEQILRDVLPNATGDLVQERSVVKANILAGASILVADDSPLARGMIEKGLAQQGASFIMTKSGREAWERIQAISDAAVAEGKTIKDKIALVLTDLEMPEMDGFTLTRKLKSDHRFKSIPVMIHSSLTGEANESLVKSSGADAYVVKFSAEDFTEAIRKAIENNRG